MMPDDQNENAPDAGLPAEGPDTEMLQNLEAEMPVLALLRNFTDRALRVNCLPPWGSR